nr:2'-5' RNA ligase family protein [Saprospiraceae bacterium]
MNLYLIALLPPQTIREEVKSLKMEMRDRFDASHALKSPAHLTLFMPIKRRGEEEGEINRCLNDIANNQSAFQVELNGFDCFPPRVLFIKVVDHQPIIRLRNAMISHLIEKLNFSPREIGLRFHPHLTIATRDLTEEAFHRAWPEFKKRTYTSEFKVDKISLLKHNGKNWEVFTESLFKPPQFI